jgi:hypothetical protein
MGLRPYETLIGVNGSRRRAAFVRPALVLSPDGIDLYGTNLSGGSVRARRRHIPWAALTGVRTTVGAMILIADPDLVRPRTLRRRRRAVTEIRTGVVDVDRDSLVVAIRRYLNHPDRRYRIGWPDEYENLLASWQMVGDEGSRHVRKA